jgi:hypothetical protein
MQLRNLSSTGAANTFSIPAFVQTAQTLLNLFKDDDPAIVAIVCGACQFPRCQYSQFS